MFKYNINAYMYIQITNFGFGHLYKTVGKDYVDVCIETKKIIIEGKTWYKLQCHHVFTLFKVDFGSKLMFNPNVMF